MFNRKLFFFCLLFLSFIEANYVAEIKVTCAAEGIGDQDDMCIWLHPEDPALSTIISSDKNVSKLFVYNMEGEELFSYSTQYKPGNIDITYNFPTSNYGLIDLIGINERSASNPHFIFYRVS